MDARRSQVYTGIYSFENNEFVIHHESCAVSIEELIQMLSGYGRRVIFIGDGIPAARDIIDAKADFDYIYAPAGMNRQRASSVAILGALYYKDGRTETAAEHLPDYLRMSQAERERKERENG